MKKLKLAIGLMGAGLLMNSCMNIDDDGQEPMPENVGWLAFINASPDSENLKFYSNGTLLNQQSIDFGYLFGYVYQETGEKAITVQGTTAVDLDTLNLNVQKDNLYSIYAINAVDHLELMTVSDNHTLPPSEKTSIRFLQLSENLPEVKVAIEGSTTDYGTYFYKEQSAFIESAGVISKKFYLIDAVSNDTLLAKNVNFHQGKSYTVFSKGIYGSTDDNKKLDIQIVPFQN